MISTQDTIEGLREITE